MNFTLPWWFEESKMYRSCLARIEVGKRFHKKGLNMQMVFWIVLCLIWGQSDFYL